jgi:hypothetical protein
MRPALLSGFVAAGAPIAVSATEDGRNVLLAIGEVGERSFLWITPDQAQSLGEQVARLFHPAPPARAPVIAPVGV